MNRKIEKINVFIFVAVFLTIVFIPSYAQQYGNLVVRVIECGCRNPIENARVEVVGVNDPTSYTNSQGYAYFYNLPIGQYLITVSKEGYKSVSKYTTIECSKTTFEEICLEKIKVCNPGEIRNRRCACPTQVAYEICKSDGSGWETVIENCPSGYVCENGKCVLNKDGWYDTSITRCNNGVLERMQEYRDYTCFGFTCTYTVIQRRWIPVGECASQVLPPVQKEEKDGWYDTSITRCNMNGYQCGYGIKERMQEYRDYTCFGVTCTYTVLAKRWIPIGDCYTTCSSGYVCENGQCIPEKIKVCNPGEIRNRRCACSTQVAYEICKSDGSGWKTVIENCPSGYVCESGFCQMKEVNCMIKIEVKDASNNCPISNALLCYNSKCYFTDYSGIASFYVSKGVYALTISKEDYNPKTIYISCEYGKDVRQTIYLDKKIKLVSCDSLDGWYYTPQTYCETGNAECGGGIMLRKEEFRDYFGFASDISQCKDYRIISIRWKEEGLCRKECREGYECSEGFCRKIEIKRNNI